jgi:hypothetical protein
MDGFTLVRIGGWSGMDFGNRRQGTLMTERKRGQGNDSLLSANVVIGIHSRSNKNIIQ